MVCLAGRIGVRGMIPVPVIVPVLYINDLPGITLENIGALATDEDLLGWPDVWRKVVQAVDKKFDTLLRAEFAKTCRLAGSVVDCLSCDTVNKPLFDIPLWYLHGVELMIYRTSTDELNRFTTIDLDKAERLKGEFYAEFQSSLTDAVSSIDLANSACITATPESAGSFRFEFNLP